MGSSDRARNRLRSIEKDCKVLGGVVRVSRAQVVFCQSSQSEKRGLKGPVKSKSSNGYRADATARDSTT